MNKRKLPSDDTNRRTNRLHRRRRSLIERLEDRHLLAVDLVSVDTTGLAAGSDLPIPSELDPSVSGTQPDLSADGGFIVFESDAEDLVENDGNGFRDVFVRDLDTGVTTLISVTREGTSADADSFKADISDDGRFITFISLATNVASDETVDNGFADVYLRDRDRDGNGVFDEAGSGATGTFLLSLGFADDGSSELADSSSDFRPAISGDGSTVVFGSTATNLVDPAIATDANLIGEDIFVVNTEGLKREVLTLNLDGDATGVGLFGEGEAELFAVSGDGSVIAFQSRFSDIVETSDDPTTRQIFVRTSKLDRISENRDGEGGDFVSRESVISRDGRHVAFITPSLNLVDGADSGFNNVYVYDLETGLLTLVSRNVDPLAEAADGNASSASGGGPDFRQYAVSISDDGRHVAYSSLATNLVDPAIADTTGSPDIFAFDRDADMNGVFDEVDVPGATETLLVSVNFTGTATGAGGASATAAGSVRPAVSGNGRYVAFASTAVDLLAEPTSGVNVFVRDLVSEVTYLASPSPDDDPVSGSSPETVGQQTISISRDGSRVAFISDSDLDSDTVDENSTRDVYVFTLPSLIDMQRFSASGSTSLNLRYEILNTPVDEGFSIDVVRSSDEVFDPTSADVVLAAIEITDPDDLSVGVHDLAFRIGGGPGEIPLPGAGAEEPSDEKPVDYFLLATAAIEDVADAPMLVEDTAVFAGFYHPPSAPIFVHGTPGKDTITATTVDGIVTFTFSAEGVPFELPLFPPDDVTGIRARTHGGDDSVTGSGFADLLIGGPGADTMFGEAGDDTMDGGPGADRVFGGDGFDMLFDSSGDDVVDTGGPEPFGGTVNGVPGSDNIYIGAGEDTLNFAEALKGITIDPRDPAFQIVDDDNNRVQATGFTRFIGSRFDDEFSLDGDVLLPYAFNGGPGGSDVLNVNALGLPAKDDGAMVQVMGYQPIEYANFARVNIFNSAPWVQARLEDELAVDLDGDGQADPGETLRYVAKITNDGAADALNVTFEDLLDPNTMLDPGTINVSPLALGDSYTAFADTPFDSADQGLSLFDNDREFLGDMFMLDSFDMTSELGANVLVRADGSFRYDPTSIDFTGQFPNDVFAYTIQDSEGATDSADVSVSVLPSFSGPIAIDDSVKAVGNTLLDSVEQGLPSLLVNDLSPPGSTFSLSDFDPFSTHGGEVEVFADGSFTYNPPVGFLGKDAFTYTITDDNSGEKSTATVTAIIDDLVWWVDNTASPGGDGRSHSPFNGLDEIRSGNRDEPDDVSDIIYVRHGTGDYAGGIVLLPRQQLYGENATLVIDGMTIIEGHPALTPTIHGAVGETGLVLATDNTVKGLDFDTRQGDGLVGSDFGKVTIEDVSVNTVDGKGVSLVRGSGDIAFDSVEVLIQNAAGGEGEHVVQQVQLGVLIAEVSRTGFRKLGVNFAIEIPGSTGVLLEKSAVWIGGGSIEGVDGHGIQAIDTDLTVQNVTIGMNRPIGGDGISYAVLSDSQAEVLLRAIGNTIHANGTGINLLSAPQLVTRDSVTASIHIGSNIIFATTGGITGFANGPTDVYANITDNVARSDFNTIRFETNDPQATMGVNLASNHAGVFVISNNNAGIFKLGGTRGQGETFTNTDNRNVAAGGNLVFGKIPVLGQTLFVNHEIEIVDPELIIMLTPTLVTDLPEGELSTANNDPTIDIGTLPAGKSITIRFDARINDPLPPGITQVVNQGTVVGSNFDDVLTDDPNTPAPNDPTITSIDNAAARIADLSLVKTVDHSSATTGQNVTFTVALNNAGPDRATGVTVADKLPTGLQFRGATPSVGSYDDQAGVWTVGDVAVGATETLELIATLTSDQSARNVAQVATSDQSDPDSIPGNNISGEDDQFSANVGAGLTAGPLKVGLNRLVYSGVTPGGFAGFVMGTQAGSHWLSNWDLSVDVADPRVLVMGLGNIDGVATALLEVTEKDLHDELMFQAFEILPNQKLSNTLPLQTSDDLLGIPLRADDVGVGGQALSSDTLPTLTAAAITRWEATGLSFSDSQLIGSLDVRISDLPGDQLAASHGNFILLDSTAAGNGWFVDATLSDDIEFTSDADGVLVATAAAATDQIDALTALMHEMGHALGQDDLSDGASSDLMSPALPVGVRRLPTTVYDPQDANRDGKVSALDALVIINELAREQSLAQASGERLTANLDQALSNYDVNDDGRVSALDALHVINNLGSLAIATEAESEQLSPMIVANPSPPTLSGQIDSLDDDLLRMLADDNLNAKLR